MKYRYTYDKGGKTFTEAEWINSAIPHFIENPNAPSEEHILYIASIWDSHLQWKTIIPLDEIENIPYLEKRRLLYDQAWKKNQAKDFHFYIGCTNCHHIHDTENDGMPNKVSISCAKTFAKRNLGISEE